MVKNDNKIFIRRLLIIFSFVLSLALIYFLSDIILLLFGSILVAIILRVLTERIVKYIHLSNRWCLFFAILIITLIVMAIGFLINATVSEQIQDLSYKIPQAWESLKDKVNSYELGRKLVIQLGHIKADSGLISTFSNAAGILLNGISGLLLIIVSGIYIAMDPALYKAGFLKLIPKKYRSHSEETINCCGKVMRLWLLEKLLCMSFVTIFITLGLTIIGFPSAIALGLLAGICEFIPFIGVLIAAVPALLLAINSGPEMVLWVLVVYVIVQQIQGNIVMPLIQQRIVYLPPALTIFALIIFAALLGPLGLFFAEPLTVLFFVMIKKLYIREFLHEKTKIPGEAK